MADLRNRLPTKVLGERTWCTGSRYRRDREKGILEGSQTEFIRDVVEHFGITKTTYIPGSPSLDIRHMSDEEPVVDASYREMVGNLTWTANQIKPDIANAVLAGVPVSYDP